MLDAVRTKTRFFSGCAAVAQGAWESGVEFVAAYPGSPVTGVVEAVIRYPDITYQWSANEKVAMETAIGAAHGGSRALVVLKHVGLNVAADPFFNAAYTGVEGGLVVVIGDDPGAKSSQNEQDSRFQAWAANVPVLEPSSVAEMHAYTKLAFEISEEFDVPVVVRLTTQLCYSSESLVTSARYVKTQPKRFAAPLQKYLLLPAFVPARHEALLGNVDALSKSVWSEWFMQISCPAAAGDRRPFGIVCSGHVYSIVKEMIGDAAPIAKLGMVFPVSRSILARFFEQCDRVIVAEEGSGYLEAYIRSLGFSTVEKKRFSSVGEFSVEQLLTDEIPELDELIRQRKSPKSNTAALVRYPVEWLKVDRGASEAGGCDTPTRTPGFCAGCSHAGIFYVLSKLGVYVVGDIGCYTLGATEPFNALHANLCMGASIGILQGYLATMDETASGKVVAAIGDSTFFHSGIPPLLSAVASNRPGTILILDNNGTAMTGFQMTNRPLNDQDWEKLLDGLGVPEYEVVPALDVRIIESRLRKYLDSANLSVLVLRGDCVQGLPRKGPTNYRYTINTDLCTGCGACLETDCPSIVMTPGADNAKLFEITNECIGCGLCSQTCPEKAIVPRTVDFKFKPLAKAVSKVPWHRVIRRLRGYPVMQKVFDYFEKETY